MRKGILLIAGLSLAALALFAACTGDGEEAQATPTPLPTATAPPAADEPSADLAYIGADGAIWLANADGSDRRSILEDPCDSPVLRVRSINWSPAGDKLAIHCSSAFDIRQSVVIIDVSGNRLTALDTTAFLRWSPDGERIAYQPDEDFIRPERRYRVNVLELGGVDLGTVAEDALLLAWPLPNRMLVGLNVQRPHFNIEYDAHWLDLTTGETEPVPRLDDGQQFWLSPDAKRAVLVVAGHPRPTLTIHDLETGEERPVTGSVIGYPSEGIPRGHIAISPDGSTLYWADATDEPAVLYRANMDGSGLTRLGTVPSGFVILSPDGRVVYRIGATIAVEDLEAGTRVGFAGGDGAVAWRPTR